MVFIPKASSFYSLCLSCSSPLPRSHAPDAWLDLHSSVSGAHFLVPTLDIDLAWHTHQLHSGVLEYVKSPDIWGTTGTAGTYKADNLNVLGWFLGHDDTAGEGKLGNGLEMTEKLWKEKFGWGYTY